MNYLVFEYLNSFVFRYEWLDTAIIFFAWFLGYWMLGLFLFLLWYLPSWRARWKEIFSVTIIALILSRGIVTELIRALYPHARPFVDHAVNLLLPHEASSSFPSGHAAFYFALSFAVYAYNKKIGVLFMVLASLVSIARIMGGVHYPLDIAGGIIVSFLSVIFAKYLYQKMALRQG